MTLVEQKRREKNLSQNKLAALANVKQSVICDIEKGKTKSPRYETIVALGRVLEFSAEEFYTTKISND